MESVSIADVEAHALVDGYLEGSCRVVVDKAIYRAGRDAVATAWNDTHDAATVADDQEGMARIALDAARVGHEEPLPPELLEAVFR